MEDILKKTKSLEASELWIKENSKTIENEGSSQKIGFLIMLLGTLGATLLGHLLAFKDVIKTGEETIRTKQHF